MAIIQCPDCGFKISDKAAVCKRCGFVIEGMAPEELERKRRNHKAEAINKLTSQTMLAMLLFIAGIGGVFFFREETSADTVWQVQVSFVLMGVGFIWYIVNRIRLINVKRR